MKEPWEVVANRFEALVELVGDEGAVCDWAEEALGLTRSNGIARCRESGTVMLINYRYGIVESVTLEQMDAIESYVRMQEAAL